MAPAQTGVIRGRVLESPSGNALANASVTVDGTALGAAADSGGRFLIGGVAVGVRTIRARMIGHTPASLRVTLRAGDTADVVLRLEATAVSIAPTVVQARPPERDRFELDPYSSAVSITKSARAAIPAVGERDVLRAVQLLPGVNARNDFSAGFNVRGGEADQNLVLLAGHPVYNPFHLGGLFGTFVDEAVQGIDLITGAFPATYGGRLSSVLNVTPAVEERRGLHGTATVSLLASSMTLGSAFRDGEGGWMLAGRRTYADVLASTLSDRSLPYHFRDAQFVARHRVPGGGTATLTAYDGRDVLDGDFAGISDTTQPGGGTFFFDWGNRVAGLGVVWPRTRPFRTLGILRGDSARFEQRGGVSAFTTQLDLGASALVLANRVRDARLAGSAEWWAGSTKHAIGYEASTHRVHYAATSPQTDAELYRLDQHPTSLALWYDERRKIGPVLAEGGLRAEAVTGTGWGGVSPRLSLKWFATRDLAFTLGGGRHAQWMHSLAREDIPVRVFDFWVASDRWVAVSRADHAVAGIERWLSPTRFVRVEGYYKRYHDLLEGNPADDPARRGDEFVPAEGQSHGVDVIARQIETAGLGGWLSYSYGVSTRISQGHRYWPGHDRRHNVNAVASWQVSRRWLLAARYGIASGTPYTDIVGQLARRIYDTGRNSWDTGGPPRQLEPVGGLRNAERLPAFQRLDLSATGEYRWRGMRLAPYASIVNAYNARNVFTYTFDYTSNPPTRESISQFPLLPSVGLTVEF